MVKVALYDTYVNGTLDVRDSRSNLVAGWLNGELLLVPSLLQEGFSHCHYVSGKPTTKDYVMVKVPNQIEVGFKNCGAGL